LRLARLGCATWWVLLGLAMRPMSLQLAIGGCAMVCCGCGPRRSCGGRARTSLLLAPLVDLASALGLAAAIGARRSQTATTVPCRSWGRHRSGRAALPVLAIAVGALLAAKHSRKSR
jgi:hypothetical protein